jgi:hypothetical protein
VNAVSKFTIDRKTFIGGSDAAKIMKGEGPEVWALKTGRKTDDDLTDYLPVMMGEFTESFNRFWYEKRTGFQVRLPPANAEGVPTPIFHAHLPWMACHPDGFVDVEDVGDLVFEAKHVGQKYSMADMIERYHWQLVHNAACCGKPGAELSVFFGNSKWERAYVAVPQSDIERLIDAEATLWDAVQANEEPAVVKLGPTPAAIEAMREVDMNGSNGWADSAADFLANVDASKTFDTAEKRLKALIPKDGRRAFGYGVQVSRSKDNKLSVRALKEAAK